VILDWRKRCWTR